jgi:hypothetical protein
MNKRTTLPRKTDMEPGHTTEPSAPKLGPDIKAKIGQQLRTLYGGVVDEGVPDRFVEILRGLDEESRNASDDDLDHAAMKDEGSANELS